LRKNVRITTKPPLRMVREVEEQSNALLTDPKVNLTCQVLGRRQMMKILTLTTMKMRSPLVVRNDPFLPY
jgi:hypothetical protein